MTFTVEEMRQRFQKFGTIYTPEDIKEEITDIIGLEDKKEMLSDFFLSLKKYVDIAPRLAEAKITPNFTMLLYGPPGTGKTALTRAMAKKFDIPMGLVEADRLVSPLLGDTVKNMRGVFDLAAEFTKENGVFLLFFDEIDAITGERANAHEVGEIKRAVISFLQIIDKISYDAIPLAIFGATNHEKQLDSAVWRRFTYHLSFPFPNFIVRKQIMESFLIRLEKATISIDKRLTSSLKKEYDYLIDKYNAQKKKLGRELTDVEYYSLFTELKQKNLEGLLYHTLGYTGADLMRAMRVALFKALKKSVLLYEDYMRSLEVCGGTETHVIQSQKLAGITPNTADNAAISNTNSPISNKSSKIDDLDDLDIDL
ncbi:AAA family ATPase [Candidatus Lokiarchaeum ossiferum]|uniref:AAA family ATPase n=1 Tax=Candidatus Lokiarchaeum ossiferum TaxID=2951803 RepID=UPI00352EFB04